MSELRWTPRADGWWGLRALRTSALGAIAVACIATAPPHLSTQLDLAVGERKLANGLRVVTSPDQASTLVSLALAVRTGAGDDPAGQEGLAHAVEHLVFQAEHEHGPPFRLALDRLGARFNAYTTTEVTVYHATAPKASVEGLVRAFAGLARAPLEGVTEAALDTERGVLDNERRYRDENGAPGAVADRLRGLVFGSGRLGRPVGGTAQTLASLRLEQASTFAAAHYRPAEMTLVVAGALPPDLDAVLAPFAAIPSTGPASPAAAAPAPPPAALDADGIAHVPASVPEPELWLGWRLPGAYGNDRATMELVAEMASGAVQSGAWERHQDVSTANCHLEPGNAASLLLCRAWLRSADHAGAVRDSLIRVIRRGIADRAGRSDWRVIYARFMATEQLLDHERLEFRAVQLLLGDHFARAPRFSLDEVSALQNADSATLLAFYDATLTPDTAHAVLVLPGGAEEMHAAAAVAPRKAASAPVPALEPLIEATPSPSFTEATLENGLKVLAVERPGEAFQTALLGFLDGAARKPPAVVAAARWAHRNYLVEAPTGVLQSIDYDDDAVRHVVRGPAGDVRVLLRRLGQGLEHYDFTWKSEAYLDFTAGQRQREQDPRARGERTFRDALLFHHPFGTPVVSAHVDAVTLREIRSWYDTVHRPENAILVVVGPATAASVVAAARSELEDWQSTAHRKPIVDAPGPPQATPRTGDRLLVESRPGDSQVDLRVGCVLPPSTAASLPVEDVLVHLLSATLNDELRQRAGDTYGLQVALERLRGGTTALEASGAVAEEHLGNVLRVLHGALVAHGEIQEGRLTVARFGALVGRAFVTETSVGLAHAVFAAKKRGLSPDALNYARAIPGVSREAVVELLDACRANTLFLAVGDEAKIRAAWPGGD